jgi:hypothetical protein
MGGVRGEGVRGWGGEGEGDDMWEAWEGAQGARKGAWQRATGGGSTREWASEAARAVRRLR